jgi:hypothetical protein
MAEILNGQAIDQIDQAVLEATHVEAVDDVGDEGGHGNHWIMTGDFRHTSGKADATCPGRAA